MLKTQSLGSVASAARGLTVSAITNATPCVATFNANNRLKPLDRVAIFGTTVNTASNGIWTLGSMEYAGNTAKLIGSKGNGASTLTNTVVAVCMDRTSFMKGHSAVALIRNKTGAAVFVGTPDIKGNNEVLATATDATILASDGTTLATYFVSIPISTGLIEGPAYVAATAGIAELREIKLRKFMYFEATAYTSGGADADVIS